MDNECKWFSSIAWAIPALLFLSIVIISGAAAIKEGEGSLVYSLDDTYIHMAIAKNMARHGVWGVNSTGFNSASSSLLWTLLLSGAYWLFGVNNWTPFLLNVVFGMAILYIADFYWRRFGAGILMRIVGGLGIIISVPLSTLPLMGMEHSLHLFLTLWFAGLATEELLAGELGEKERNRYMLPFLGALLGLSRYEGLFLIGIVALLLLCRKRFVRAFMTVAAAVLPLIGFSIISLLSNGFVLPNPVILKAAGPGLSLIKGLLRLPDKRDLLAWQQNPYFAFLLILGIALALLTLVVHRKWRAPGFLLPVFLVAMIFLHFHYGFSPSFWVYRYSAYLIAFGIFAVIAFFPGPWNFRGEWRSIAKIVAAVAVPVLVIGQAAEWQEGVFPRRELFGVRQNFLEHIGVAYFVRAIHPREPFVVNDIGAVCFFCDTEMLDMFGLGNAEPLRFRKETLAREKAALDAWVRSKGSRIAILQVQWQEIVPRIPDTWTKAGEVEMPVSGKKIGFFSLDRETAGDLRRKLLSFYQVWWQPRGIRFELRPIS